MTIRRLVLIIVFIVGGTIASQFPEFAQQYRQRLGGALDELERIAMEFDRDAAKYGLSREQALATYARSGEPFLGDQGQDMAQTLARRDRLKEQEVAIDLAGPLLRPVQVFLSPDAAVMDGAWEDFEPAVPVTAASFFYFALGGLALLGCGSGIGAAAGAARRRIAFLRTRMRLNEHIDAG